MNEQGISVWNEIFLRLKEQVSGDNFDLWLSNLRLEDLDTANKKLYIAAPNPFIKDWVWDYHLSDLKVCVESVLGNDWSIELVVSKKAPAVASVQNKVVDISKAKSAATSGRSKRRTLPKHINPSYTFENFVRTDGNEIPRAAAVAVADFPGKRYNPLFVYGGTGLGKTHLLHAIANRMFSSNPRTKILYIPAETFVNEFIASLHTGSREQFRNRFRTSCDVLMIDDFQFLAGKLSSQEEFLHTFNHLYQMGRQIVVASDTPPQLIRGLDTRLVSRLRSGLVVGLFAARGDSLLELVEKKAEAAGIGLSRSQAEYIVSAMPEDASVRDVEGVLNRIQAFAELSSRPVSDALIREALKDFLARSMPTDPEEIIKTVASYYSVLVISIKGKNRTHRIAFPRQVAMYLIKQLTDLSLKEIGALFGGRDHSTVLHSLSKIERLIIEDVRVQHDIDTLLERIRNGK